MGIIFRFPCMLMTHTHTHTYIYKIRYIFIYIIYISYGFYPKKHIRTTVKLNSRWGGGGANNVASVHGGNSLHKLLL